MVPEEFLDRAQSVLGRTFADRSLLARALTHASAAPARVESNERLEFLGDAVLGMIACRVIHDRYPGLLEGEMTKIKSTVVSRATCAILARQTGLDELLVTGKGMRTHKKLPQSLAAGVFEAAVAAIYSEAGMDATAAWLEPLLIPMIDRAEASGHQENFKSVLQQHAAQAFNSSPSYVVLDEQGPDHAKAFEVCVEIGTRRFASAWGQSKKEAEQKAALEALRTMGVMIEDVDGRMIVVIAPPPRPAAPDNGDLAGSDDPADPDK